MKRAIAILLTLLQTVEFVILVFAIMLIAGGVCMILRPEPMAISHIGVRNGVGMSNSTEVVMPDAARWYGFALTSVGCGLVAIVIFTVWTNWKRRRFKRE